MRIRIQQWLQVLLLIGLTCSVSFSVLPLTESPSDPLIDPFIENSLERTNADGIGSSKALNGLAQQLGQAGYTMTLAQESPYNNSYSPQFIVRLENGQISEINASQLNTFVSTQFNNVWGVGIRSKYGIVAFYTNDQDPTWGHTQLITYPVFSNGSLPPLNKPIMGTFLRLWVNAGGIWYRNFITSQPLFQSNGVDPRRWMVAQNTTEYLELGWNATLELQGFDFELYVGMRLNYNDTNQIQIKTNITSLDRGWDGLGLEYVLGQSSFYDGSDEQILYGTVENDTFTETYRLSQFRDMTVEIPSRFNQTQILTRSNRTVHTFDWDDMRDSGFDTSLFRIENMELPNGVYDWVIRTGMYGLRTVPQGYTIEIDPTVTVTSDATRAFPFSVCRDSNNIPYVLALIGTTLKVFKGDAGNPTSWSNETVGDGNVSGEHATGAYLLIGTYSSVEYLWVFRVNDDPDVVLDRSTVSAFSFPGGSTITIDTDTYINDDTGGISADYGENRLVIHYCIDNDDFVIKHSTNGGTTWSNRVGTWSETSYAFAGFVAWDESFWQLGLGRETITGTLWTKRWSSGAGLQYWDGDSWESSTTADNGFDTNVIYFRGGIGHAKATSNIIVFGRPDYGGYKANVVYSLDGGQTWSTVPGMGYDNYAGFPSFTILTNSTHEDDFITYASNQDSDGNDVNTRWYNKTADSFGDWTLYSDSGDTADIISHFTGELKQGDNEWVSFTYQWDDDSESTFYLNFTTYHVGSEGGDSTAPTFSYTGTTNESSVEYGTSITGNWSITEANPDTYIIYSNTTSVNESKSSGSYNNGDFKSWSFENTNSSLLGETIFIEIWANDTSANSNSSIVYFDIVDTTAPSFTYDGTSTTNNSNVEYESTILANWSITELLPSIYVIYANNTGVNVTKSSGAFSNGDYKSWSYQETNISNIGKTIFIQIYANDTSSNSNNSIAYFNIVDTGAPQFSYVGDTNNTSLEYGTDFTGNWSITDVAPDIYSIFSNSSAANETEASGSYSSGDYKAWIYTNNNASNIGNTLFIDIWANDTSNNLNNSIVYFDVIESVPPTFTYFGTTNNSQVHLGTNPIGNWSISEPNIPDTYIIWSNSTGTNETKSNGSYSHGDYKAWTYTNNNESNVDDTVFIEIYANDTQANENTSIAYFEIYNDVPSWEYTGSTNNTDIEWEIGGSFTASWQVSEGSPSWYFIFYNATGSNSTYANGSYEDEEILSGQYDPGVSDIGALIFFQLKLNDTWGNSNSSIVYFTVVNTNPPSVTINRPENSTYTGGKIEIWLASSNLDLDTLWWALYYATNDTLIEGNVTWTETVERSLADELYYLNAFCNDSASLEGFNIVYFTLTTGAVVSGGPGYVATTIPLEPDVLPPSALIQYKTPGILILGGIVAGFIIVHERFGDSINPEEEFRDYKKQIRREIARAYYGNKKKTKRSHTT